MDEQTSQSNADEVIQRVRSKFDARVRRSMEGRFEYLFANVTLGKVYAVNERRVEDGDDLLAPDYANKVGNQGWQLVSAVPIRESMHKSDDLHEYAYTMIFRRRIEDEQNVSWK